MLMRFLLAQLLFVSAVSHATVPEDPNTIIASWKKSDTEQKLTEAGAHIGGSLENLAPLLKTITLPGLSSEYVGHIEQALKEMSEGARQSPEYLYLLARLQQHKHEFEPSLMTLKKLLLVAPYHVNGWLLKSSVHQLLGQYEQAEKACKKTFGLVDIQLSLLCQIDVFGARGDTEESYQALKELEKADRLYAPEIQDWLYTSLSEQAYHLGLHSEAAEWADKLNMEEAPLSTWLLWADIHLSMGKSSVVLNRLNRLVSVFSPTQLSDAMIIRLAMAEKQSEKRTSEVWRIRADDRVQLRLDRNDTLHAAELARYFIFVEGEQEQGKYWSGFNYKQSKSYDDERLVAAAQKLETL